MNEFAVSAADVGEGLSKCASVMQQGGASIEEASAMFTGMNETLQDASTSGTALKVMTLRIRSMKGELEEMGEDVDDSIESVSKVQTQILNYTGGKVNIFDEDGNFRDIYNIMDDIAGIYDDLSDTNRSGLLEVLAGKTRANAVQAMLSNWSQVEKALTAANEAEGTAAEENEVQLNTIEAKITQLQAAAQELATDFADSSAIKGFIDLLRQGVNFADSLVETLGGIPTVIGLIAGGLSAFKGIGVFTQNDVKNMLFGTGTFSEKNNSIITDEFKDVLSSDKNTMWNYFKSGKAQSVISDNNNLTKFFEKNSDIDNFGDAWDKYSQSAVKAQIANQSLDKSFGNVKNIISTYNEGTSSLGITSGEFAEQISKGNTVLGNYLTKLNGAQGSFSGYIASLVKAKAASLALSVATSALNMGIGLIASELISFGITQLDNFINRTTKLAEKNKELADSAKEVREKYTDNADSLGSYISQYESIISDGVIDSTEASEVETIQSNIVSLVGDQADGLNLVNGNLDEQLAKLKEIYAEYARENSNDVKNSWLASKVAADTATGEENTGMFGLGGLVGETVDASDAVSNYVAQVLPDYLQKYLIYDVDSPLDVVRGAVGSQDYDLNFSGDAEERYNQIQQTLDYINANKSELFTGNMGDNVNGDVAYSQLVSTLETLSDKYKGLIDSESEELDAYLNNKIIEHSTDTAIKHSTVKSSSDFEAYRKQLIQTLSTDDDIQEALMNGNLSSEDLDSWVEEYMSTLDGFSDYYNTWLKNFKKQKVDSSDNTDSTDEYVYNALGFDKDVNKDKDSALYGYKAAYEAEKEKASQYVDDLSQTQFGNIDTNNRQIINWDYQTLNKYKDALQSWNEEAKDNWNIFEAEQYGSYSTVKGGWSTWGINDEEVPIAFSPILQTEDGKGEYLDKDTVLNYISKIVDEANQDGEWDAEEIFKLDATGLEVDGKKIKGLIADVGDTAEKTASAMHYLGKDGTIAFYGNELYNYAQEKDEFDQLYDSDDRSELQQWYESLPSGQKEIMYNVIVNGEEAIYDVETAEKALEENSYNFSSLMAEEDAETEEAFQTKIDNYTSQMSTLQDALRSYNNGELKENSEEWQELVQSFPELAGHYNDLTNAIESQMLELTGEDQVLNEVGETVSNATGIFAAYREAYNSLTTDKARAQLNDYMNTVFNVAGMTQEAWDKISFQTFTDNISTATEQATSAITALSTSLSDGGLSLEFDEDGEITGDIKNIIDAYKDLDGYDMSKLFVATANGIQVNRDELQKLQKTANDNTMAKFADEYTAISAKLSEARTTLQSMENKGSSEYNSQLDYVRSLEDQLTEVELLSASYQQLTSDYQAWINAQSYTGGDMYDNVQSNIEGMKELYNNGEWGVEFQAGVQAFTNDDLSGASVDEYIAKYEEEIPRIERYFTEDNTGVGNFLDDLAANIDGVTKSFDEAGNSFYDFSGAIDTDDVAEKLGINAELVEGILEKLRDDYGFDIEFMSDEQEKLLNETTTKAQEAQESINSIYANTKYSDIGKIDLSNASAEEIDTEITNVQTALDEINSGETKIDIDSDEIEQTEAYLQALQAQKAALEQTNNGAVTYDDYANGSDALTQLQERIQSIDSLNKDFNCSVSVTGDTQVQTLAEQIASLPSEVKTTLGFEAEDTADDIIEQLTSTDGETVTVPVDVQDDDATVDVDTDSAMSKVSDLQTKLNNLVSKQYTAKVTVSDTSVGAEATQTENISVTADTGSADSSITEIKKKAMNFANGHYQATVTANIDSALASLSAVYGVANSLNGLNPVITVTVNTASADGDLMRLQTKINNLKSSLSGLPLAQGTANASGTANVRGSAFIQGTALAGGTAFAKGDWGVKDDGVALGGEVGQELVVRNGRFFTIGDDGAEFFRYKRNDIVFNAGQTAQIFKYGKIKNGKKRGEVFADGSAFSNGSVSGRAFSKFSGSGTLKTTSSSSGSSGGSSDSTSGAVEQAAEDTSNAANTTTKAAESTLSANDKYSNWIRGLFDWIEIKLDRWDDRISNISQKAEDYFSVNNNVSGRKAYDTTLEYVRTQISNQTKAQNKYTAKANQALQHAVNLGMLNKSQADTIQQKMKDGDFSISEYVGINSTNKEENSGLIAALDEYQTWYDKAYEAGQNIKSLNSDLLSYASSLQDALKDYTDALADIPVEEAQKKIETAKNNVEVWSTMKGGNASRSNEYLEQQNNYAYDTYDAYQTELTAENKGMVSARNSVKKQLSNSTITKLAKNSKTKYISNTFNKVYSYMSQGKEVPESLITKIEKILAKSNIKPATQAQLSLLLQNIYTWNSYKEAYDEAYQNARIAAIEKIQTKTDNIKSMTDNTIDEIDDMSSFLGSLYSYGAASKNVATNYDYTSASEKISAETSEQGSLEDVVTNAASSANSTFYNNTKSLKNQLAQVEKQIKTAKANYDNLKKLTARRKELAAMLKKAKEGTKRYTTLQKKIATYDAKIANANTYTSLVSQKATLEKEIASENYTNATGATLNDTYKTLKHQLNVVTNKTSSAKADYDKLDFYKSRLAELTAMQKNAKEGSKRYKTLQSKIDSYNKKIANANKYKSLLSQQTELSKQVNSAKSNADEYNSALKTCKSCIANYKYIPTDVLAVIQKYDTDGSVYNSLLSYNTALDEELGDRSDIASEIADDVNTAIENIATKYENIASDNDAAENLIEAKKENAFATRTTYTGEKEDELEVNKYVADQIQLLEDNLANEIAELDEYAKYTDKAGTSILDSINDNSWKDYRFNAYDSSTQDKVNSLINDITNKVGKQESIDEYRENLYTYYKNGMITATFLASCISYMDAYNKEKEINASVEISKQSLITQKRTYAKEAVDNIENAYEYGRKIDDSVLSNLQSAQSLRNTLGAKDSEVNLGEQNIKVNKTIESLQNQIAEETQEIQDQLTYGNWTEDSEEYIDAIADLNALTDTLNGETETFYKNMQDIRQLKLDKLEAIADAYKVIIDSLEDINDLVEVHGNTASIDSLTKEIQAYTSLISNSGEAQKTILDNVKDWIDNEFTVLANDTMSSEDYAELMNDFVNQNNEGMNDIFEKYGTSYADLEAFQEFYTDYWDENSTKLANMVSQEKALDSVFDKYQSYLSDYKDYLQDIHDAEESALELQKAQYEYDKAVNNKTVRTWKDGEWVYTSDYDAVKSAQENLDSVVYNQMLDGIDKAVDNLDKIKDFLNIYDDEGNVINEEFLKTLEYVDAFASNFANTITGEWQRSYEEIIKLITDAGWKVAGASTGGVIGGSDNSDRSLIRVSSMERVLTAQQNKAFETLVDGLTGSSLVDMFSGVNNMLIPSSGISNNNEAQEINQTFNITLPNINDSSTAQQLMSELQNISLKKIQYFNTH